VASNEIRHRATLVRDLESVPPVMGDRSRLAQVFLNLDCGSRRGIAAALGREARKRRDIHHLTMASNPSGVGIPASARASHARSSSTATA
jgi:nitrogen-specific signal transduction histidine kinase